MTALPSAWALRPCPGCARWATCRQTDEGPRCLVCAPVITLAPIPAPPALTPHQLRVYEAGVEALLGTLTHDWREKAYAWADRRDREYSERKATERQLHDALCELAPYQRGER